MTPLDIVRKWVAPYVGESGKHETDSDVLDAINEARRIAYPLGNWIDTVDTLILQCHQGYATLPFWADVIVNAWHNNQQVEIENQWYQRCHDASRFRGACCDDSIINLGDKFAAFRIATRPFRIKVVPQDDRDKDAVLTFHGVSEYGEPVLLTRVLTGPWIPVTADPTSDKWIKYFTYCEKPKTFGRVKVYMWDIVRGTEDLCAVYEAVETNPQYRRYRVPKGGHRNQIVVKVKKKYVDLTDDKELVDIHTDALIHLLQAITARRNRDPQTYAAQVKSARDFLDKEIESKDPVQTHGLKLSHVYRDTNLGFGSEEGQCYPY
jgi:hypothetical protein